MSRAYRDRANPAYFSTHRGSAGPLKAGLSTVDDAADGTIAGI
jgi:hypothetical protein